MQKDLVVAQSQYIFSKPTAGCGHVSFALFAALTYFESKLARN